MTNKNNLPTPSHKRGDFVIVIGCLFEICDLINDISVKRRLT